VADYDKVIPPGQEGKVNIKLDGKKLFPGMFEKNFTVKTNDPANAQFVLVVTGTVKKTFEFSREMRWTGFVDDKFDFEVVVTSVLPTPINITSARWADDVSSKLLGEKIGIKLETIAKGKKYRIRLLKKKELAPETTVANIVLTTDFPKIKEKSIPMSIIVQKEVEVYPDRIYFGEMIIPAGATKAFDRTFNIVAVRGDSLKIIKAVPNRDDMTVKIQELQPGKSYRGTVWVRPANRIGQYAGSVKIYTNNPKYREINLDIVGSIRVGDAVGGVPQKSNK
jgi:hypothetical protein